MVTIELTSKDLTELRFAFSPMWELVMSYRVLRNPARHALFLPWAREALGILENKNLPYLNAAVQPTGYFPDYLTPTPTTPFPSFDEELARLSATPPEEVRRDALRIDGQAERDYPEVFRCYLEQPERALEHLGNDLQAYWDAVLEPHWSYIQKRLEGDVLRKAQQLTLEGSHALFSSLHPLLNVEENTLKIERKHERYVHPSGLGLLLVPIFFSWPDLYYLAEPGQRPLIGYSPSGTALWERGGEGGLELALGSSRAKVLRALCTPQTPSILAEDMGMSVGAISQHLGRLRKAGLVEPHRSGRNTFYRLTSRGTALIELFIPFPVKHAINSSSRTY